MPVYNITVKDTSADVVYVGQWTDTPTADALLSSYINGTCHSTNAVGSTASISFYGTAVYVYGARRPDHDAYSIALDGQVNYTGNGFSATPLFQQLLYNTSGLDPGQHNVTMTDISTTGSRPWLDVDYIIITAGNGDDSTIHTDTQIDDTAANIIYTDQWNTSDPLMEAFWNSTGHETNTTQAQAIIPFTGNAIMIYGSTNTYHGSYSISIDGGTLDTRSGVAATFRAQTLLYYAGGLSSGNHTAIMTNIDKYLDLDYYIASDWTTPAPPQSQTSGSSPASTSGSSSSNTRQTTAPVGAIAGGVVGGCATLLLIGLVLWLMTRSSKKNRQAVDLLEDMQQRSLDARIDPLAHLSAEPFPPPSGKSADIGHSLVDNAEHSIPVRPASSTSFGTGPGSSRFQEIQDYAQPPPDYYEVSSSRDNVHKKTASAARTKKSAS